MTSDPPDPERDPPDEDEDLGTPVSELSGLTLPVDPRFGDRVRNRIERRLLGGQLLDLAWTAPLMMLLEFLRIPFDLLSGRRPQTLIEQETGTVAFANTVFLDETIRH